MLKYNLNVEKCCNNLKKFYNNKLELDIEKVCKNKHFYYSGLRPLDPSVYDMFIQF